MNPISAGLAAVGFRLAIGTFLVWVFNVQAVDIIAHRGASSDAPENTVAAFKLGWEQGADADELDIHLSRDGRIVVIHDADTRRTTGVAGKVIDQDWTALRTLDAGSWKGPAWRGEKLPTLEESLATVPAGRRMLIEIKCGPEILPALERTLAGSSLGPEQLVLIGFGHETMVQAKKRFPHLRVMWLSGFKQDKVSKAWTPSADDLIRQAKAGGLDGVSVNFQGPIDAAFVHQVKAAGLQFHVWTVDDPAVARRMVAAGVDSITTNRPRWLRDQLARP